MVWPCKRSHFHHLRAPRDDFDHLTYCLMNLQSEWASHPSRVQECMVSPEYFWLAKMVETPLVARQASDPHPCARPWPRSLGSRLLFVKLRPQVAMSSGDPGHRPSSFQCSAVHLSSRQSLTVSSAVRIVCRCLRFCCHGPPPLLCLPHPLLRR